MTTKPNTEVQASESSGSAILAQHPPNVFAGSHLLASSIPLPPHPLICCSVFTPTHSPAAPESLTLLEKARKQVVLHNREALLAESLLPRLLISKDCVALYIFAVGSEQQMSAAQRSLAEWSFSGLECSERYDFAPSGIYPCSLTCSMLLTPCDACLQLDPADEASIGPRSSSSAPVCLLPRIPLRRPVSQFMQAVIDRLLDDYTRAQSRPTAQSPVVARLRNGVLLGPPTHSVTDEWSSGWEHYVQTTPLSYCELQVHFTPTTLLIHPVLKSTQYLPLIASLPLAAGSPIMLLPHGVPAYYLNTYSGPSGGLAHQFEDAFVGLGAGNWKDFLKHPRDDEAPPSSMSTFMIGWLPIQNKQGEDKGLPFIWPLALCIALDPALHPRTPLSYIPELPAQLLASPPAHAARGPPIQFPLSSLPSSMTLSGLSSPEPPRTFTPQNSSHLPSAVTVRPAVSRASGSDSLIAFRSLSIGGRSSVRVALEVSQYVDVIAKERDKERERLKRERDPSFSKSPASPSKSESRFVREDRPRSSTAAIFQQPTPTSVAGDNTQQYLHSMDDLPSSVTASTLLPPVDITSPPRDIPQPMTGVVASLDVSHANAEAPVSAHPGDVVNASTAYDGFSGFDSTWEQATTDFMDIDMPLNNYDMGFPMGIAGNNGNDQGGYGMDDDGFGIFTDDDFNFFDAPQNVTRPTINTSPSHTINVTHGPQMTGPGPPVISNDSTWQSHYAVDGLTPRSIGASTPGLLPADPLFPPSPEQTPSSHSGPATPLVVLADRIIHIRRSSVSSQGSSSFEPIPFAMMHKSADEKYALGKFALSSRTGEASSAPSALGWKTGYANATDPRIGVVRRLAGAKRKRLGISSPGRKGAVSPSWVTEHEEWIGSSPRDPPETELDSASSSESEAADDDPIQEERSIRPPSRVHTPPPSYLPLGPSLIATNFNHSYLLPLSRNLKPPGVSDEPHLVMTMGAMSVPTPVSPAAALGATSERNRSLESAAQIIVREMVENPLWASAWRASAIASRNEARGPMDAWQVYNGYVLDMLGSVKGASSFVELSDVLTTGDTPSSQPSIRELEQPMLLVSKSDALVRILPTSLRFWEKLGLRPRIGDKNVVAFAFFEASDDDREAEIAEWINAVSAAYTAKNLGNHTLGREVGCNRNGLVPVHLDAFRKTLVSFVASLQPVDTPMVFYIVTPTRAIHQASPVFRHLLSAVKKVKKHHPDAPILFHFVPEAATTRNLDAPAMQHAGLDTFVEAVYDRILIPVERLSSRNLEATGPKRRAFFQEPTYVLSGDMNRKPTFLLEDQPSTLDIMNRHAILHVGYQTSPCGKWLAAACVDQWGEAHDLRTWLLPSTELEDFVVENVWSFASAFASKASIQWRIAIAKLGFMEEAEHRGWARVLLTTMPELPPWQVTVLVVDPGHPWTFLPPDRPRAHRTPKSPPRISKPPPGMVLRELTAATYLVHYDFPFTIPHDPHDHASTTLPFIPDMEDEKPAEHAALRPVLSSALIRAPAGVGHTPISMLHLHLLYSYHSPHATTIPDRTTFDEIAQSYHDLAVLAHLRWKLKANPILPFHLAAVEVMSSALTCHDSLLD